MRLAPAPPQSLSGSGSLGDAGSAWSLSPPSSHQPHALAHPLPGQRLLPQLFAGALAFGGEARQAHAMMGPFGL